MKDYTEGFSPVEVEWYERFDGALRVNIGRGLSSEMTAADAHLIARHAVLQRRVELAEMQSWQRQRDALVQEMTALASAWEERAAELRLAYRLDAGTTRELAAVEARQWEGAARKVREAFDLGPTEVSRG